MENLSKKTKAQLIDMINEYESRIKGFTADMNGMEEIHTKDKKEIESLTCQMEELTAYADSYTKKYFRMKKIATFRKKVVFGLLATTIFLIIVLVI